MNVVNVLLIGLLVETLVEIAKTIIDTFLINKKTRQKVLLIFSCLTGIVMCIVLRINIFDGFGFGHESEYVMYIVTGLIVSRGSNFLHTFINNVLEIVRNKAK